MSWSARSQGLGADLDSMFWGNRRRFEYILVSGLGRSFDSDGVCILICGELARVQHNPLIQGKKGESYHSQALLSFGGASGL